MARHARRCGCAGPPTRATTSRTFAPAARGCKVARGAGRAVPARAGDRAPSALGVARAAGARWRRRPASGSRRPRLLAGAGAARRRASSRAGVTTAAKWLLVGRIRAVEHPLWSSFVWRNEVADTFVEMVAAPWFARARDRHARAQRVAARARRADRAAACGARPTGCPRPTWSRSATAPPSTGAACVQTHLFHDRIMSMDTVTLERGRDARARTASSCPAATHRRAAPRSGPARSCMRGEAVPAGTPLDRQPDRALDDAGRSRHDGSPTPPARRRRRGRPVPARARQRAATASSRYDLDLDYRVAQQPARRHGRGCTRRGHARLDRFSLDLVGLRVAKVTRRRRAARARSHAAAGQAARHRRRAGRRGRAVRRRRRSTAGAPAAVGGTLGRGRLGGADRRRARRGPADGAPSWFPCNDHPSDKATYRIAVDHRRRPTTSWPTATLDRAASRASRTRWVYEQREPMATYLATVQIGRYDDGRARRRPVRQIARCCPRGCERDVAHDFGRQPEMMALFERLFGPYPFARLHRRRHRRRPRDPARGAGAVGLRAPTTSTGDAAHERLVAHELAHQWFGNSLTVGDWRDIWLNEGFACYAEWLWSEDVRRPSRPTRTRAAALARLARAAAGPRARRPGPGADVRRPASTSAAP